MKLVIVESTEKAQRLRRILSADYEVRPCFGLVRKLALRELRVGSGGEFAERYELLPNQQFTLGGIRRAAREASVIYLATTPDREGDLLAWDISECLPRRERGKVRRLMLGEITAAVVREALGAAREIDVKLAGAARARHDRDRSAAAGGRARDGATRLQPYARLGNHSTGGA